MKRECLTQGLRLKLSIVLRYFMFSYFSVFVLLLQIKTASPAAFSLLLQLGSYFVNSVKPFGPNVSQGSGRLFQHYLALVTVLPWRILHPLQACGWLVQCCCIVSDRFPGRLVSACTLPASALRGALCHNECWRKGRWLRMMHGAIEALHHRR